MRHIVLHAGLPKTGSSAIQAFVAERRKALRRLGILVPKVGTTDSGKHKPLVLDMLGEFVPPGHQGSAAEFWQQVARNPAQKVLLSSEHLSEYFAKEGSQAKLLDVLRQAGFRTTILMYVRPDAERVSSAYVQKVKSFWVDVPFRRFALKHADRNKAWYAQFLTLARPPDVETIFRPYDAELRRNGVVGDLLATIGVSPKDRAALGEERRVNEAPVGPIAVAAAIATLSRLQQNGGKITGRQRTALQLELLRRVAEEEWQEPRFQGVDAGLFQAMEDCVAEEQERFAQAAWGRSWEDVFGSGRQREWNSNVFDPAHAEPEALERYQRLCEHLWSSAQTARGRKAGDKGGKRARADAPDASNKMGTPRQSVRMRKARPAKASREARNPRP